MINGGFFVLSPKVLDLITGRPDTVWEREPLERLARRASSPPSGTRLLAADGHAARQEPSRGAVGAGKAPWKSGSDAAFWRRPPGAADGAHRLQGQLAGAVAAVAGRQVTGLSRCRRRASRACSSWRAWRRHALGGSATSATSPPARVVAARRAPEVVFHLAAQPLVRASYAEPVETYATNVMGTVHLLEAVRAPRRARRWSTSPPTSATRTASGPGATAKTIPWAATTRTAAARLRRTGDRRLPAPPSSATGRAGIPADLATARAGNVIGGGDWAAGPAGAGPDRRLRPTAPRAGAQPAGGAPLAARARAAARLPAAGAAPARAARGFSEAWNFGPASKTRTVEAGATPGGALG
jgi:CDP-glucose 4,6-dehydratase